MDNRVTVAADELAIPAPLVNVTIATMIDPGELRQRTDKWQSEAAAILAPLADRPAVPAAAAIENLERAIAQTEGEIDTLQSQLSGSSSRLANAAAAGQDLAAIEVNQAGIAAKLVSLRARLPALQAKVRDSRKDRNIEEATSEGECRQALRRQIESRINALVAKLIPAGLMDEGGLADQLAALQIAAARLAR